MKYNFNEKVAVITGGSTGIGKEIAKAFAENGAKVVINYLRSEESANETVQLIKEQGGEALAVKGDVTLPEDVKKIFAAAKEAFGRVDILVNNAGGMVKRCPFEELDENVWDEVYDLNVKSVFLCTKEVLPLMKEQGGGTIINMSSIAARNGGGPGSVHYASAKGAVLTLTKGLAKELLPYNIRVNGINPGVIGTPFHEKYTPEHVRSNFKKGIPMGREGRADEIAGAALFLASEDASYICGETIEINGGQLMD